MFTALLISAMAINAATGLPSWTFTKDQDIRSWEPNLQLKNAAIRNGALHAEASGTDPFFSAREMSFAATPWQYVVIRIKASRPGSCDLFWSGTVEGAYGGLNEAKKTTFKVPGDGAFHDVAVFPFWQTEKTIRQMRFDVYDDAAFDIESIKVLAWGAEADAQKDTFTWKLNGDLTPWRVSPSASEYFAPPLNLAVKSKGWVTVRLQSPKDSSVGVIWSTADGVGSHSEDIAIQGDPAPRTYNLELQGNPDWHDGLVAFGVRLPEDARDIKVESIEIADKPSGPAELVVSYFGFENAISRAERPCRVFAQVTNRGGSKSAAITAKLSLPKGARLAEGKDTQPVEALPFGEQTSVAWTVIADQPGDIKAELAFDGADAPKPQSVALRFAPAFKVTKAAYVPEPKPVATSVDICMYYFPGWNSDAKWDCIRRVAPIRKPLLGYYDEGNPECVDWQIKWAVENGIKCFLVDWYWTDGHQMLTHWFDAYRKAKYRDQLKVAIMWANHNPPGTHSAADWKKVTQHWIDQYFKLPAYYRIDGKPAVFIWDPDNLRNDLKSSAAVKAVLDDSQAMARAAGYDGITYAAVNRDESPAQAAILVQEGYTGSTNYHEFGKAPDMAPDQHHVKYEDLVATAPQRWETYDTTHGKLVYYPQVDTGWDARPWHGNKTMVIGGRTPDRFEALLRKAKDFAAKTNKKIIVLGPANEWGEGSYIEPCAEYGFDMYERVRNVFALGDPASFPTNLTPEDVGLGPYEFKHSASSTSWTFDHGADGWTAMMNLADVAVKDGALRMKTTSDDPALVVDTPGLNAETVSKAVIKMQITGAMPPNKTGQLFWSQGGAASTEATSVHFKLETDGKPHTYTIELKSNPRWRGKISSLRLDPCETKGVEVVMDQIDLTK
ncbi:MAG: glycoside hydrolase family 99-like domain-containing protein [Candidatus Hydrogenedentes bacterium]|nr:glycoside hydrolase family 99-like domain-containing protein [Candidatus Hydrogenedentota bacterium]